MARARRNMSELQLQTETNYRRNRLTEERNDLQADKDIKSTLLRCVELKRRYHQSSRLCLWGMWLYAKVLTTWTVGKKIEKATHFQQKLLVISWTTPAQPKTGITLSNGPDTTRARTKCIAKVLLNWPSTWLNYNSDRRREGSDNPGS